AHAQQGKPALVIRVNQFVRGGRHASEDSEPCEGILPFVELNLIGGHGRAADPVEAVAAGDEIASDFVFRALVHIMNFRLGVQIGDAHGLGFETNWPIAAESRGDQVLHHFLLSVDGDGLSHQLLKIDAVPFPGKTQFDALMLQAFALHARAYAGFPQHVHGALFEHAGAHAIFNIFARVAFKNHAFDSLQVQQVGEHQTRGPGSNDPYLCSDGGHDESRLPQENLSITSLGMGWLFTMGGSPGSRTVQTRFSRPSTARTSPRKSLCCSEKLLLPHLVTHDSTMTISPNDDGTLKLQLASTNGMPAILKRRNISALGYPSAR